MKKLHIHSAPYAGGTILSRWLSQIDGAIAVGEAKDWCDGKRETKEKTGQYCSCGQKMMHCPVWSSVSSLDELYEKLENEGYGLVITKNNIDDENTLSLKKSFWNAYKSARKRRKLLVSRMRRKYPVMKVIPQFFVPPVVTALYLKSLECSDGDITIQYEDFVDSPDDTLKKVSKRVGIHTIGEECSHIALSNRSKYAPLVIRK